MAEMRKTYQSLAGYEVCIGPEDHQVTIKKEQLEPLITDPITYDYIQDPVIFDGHIYDHASIVRWIRQSGTNPLTGKEVLPDPSDDQTKASPLRPFLALKYLLLCLEEHPDKSHFIYHQIQTDREFALTYVQYLPPRGTTLDLHPESHTKLLRETSSASVHLMQDLTMLSEQEFPRATMFFNCILPDWISTNPRVIIQESYRYLLPLDFLLTDHFTGQPSYGQKMGCNSAGQLTILRESQMGQSEVVPVPSIQTTLLEWAEEMPLVHWVPPFNLDYSSLWSSDNRPQRLVSEQDYLNSGIQDQAMIQSDETLQVAVERLAELTEQPAKLNFWRKVWLVPGEDWSYLDLQEREFTQCVWTELKFVRTNFSGSKFVRCTFDRCVFTGSHLSGCIFQECSFVAPRATLGLDYDSQTKFDRCIGIHGAVTSITQLAKLSPR